MKRPFIRILSLCLFLFLLIGSAGPAFAAMPTPDAEIQDSNYFSYKNISVIPAGSGKLNITVNVRAKSIMTELGATQICVYQKQSDGSYQEVHTYTRYNQPGMILTKQAFADVNITYPGTAGKYYYVTAACYCKNSAGSETAWVGSKAVKA